jgi:type IV secretory pathway VirB2 component (pilin)
MIPTQKILPCVLIVIDICAAIVYQWKGDWKHAGYWVAAGMITFFATV